MSKTGPRRGRERSRARWVGVAAVVVAVAAAGAALVLTRLPDRRPADEPQPPSQAATVAVAVKDLTEKRSLTGSLGYGQASPLTGRKAGTITALPSPGTVLDRGKPVYSVDARPVPLFFSDMPLYRDLAAGMTDGPDVKVVEENLRALGFGGFGAPDKKFTEATAAAIKKWQKSLGVDQSGVLGAGDVVITTGRIRVDKVTATLGDPGTGKVLEYTGTAKAITVELKSTQADLLKAGTKVTLSIADKTGTGTVAAVAAATGSGGAPGGDGGQSDQGTVATVTLDDAAAFGDVDSGKVTVSVVAASRKGVLTVPIGALLALAEGGYAVEVVETGQTRLLAVTTGLFVDGDVEVSGPGLTSGLKVVTTS
ncbi:MAG TPA: peptidoglycan-binding protein [Actinokineospora sp.]|nr:peptidoglycan-binding protein [Actinokineospora sp.]